MLSLEANENPVSSDISAEVSAGAGTLLVVDDGTSGYWQSGLVLNMGPHFFLGFNLGQFYSNLPWLNTSIFGLSGKAGFETSKGGFTFGFGFFEHSSVSAVLKRATLTNEGGQGNFFSIETKLHLVPITIAPCFFIGQAKWEDGDLYWFFGKPEIPSFLVYGLTLYFDQQDHYRHGLGFRLFSADININSNRNAPVFNSYLNGGILFYQIALERAQNNYLGTLGFFYAKAVADGSLNTSNQPYFLFPYLFFNLNVHIKAHAGFALFGFQHNRGIFQHSIDAGIFHIFNDQAKIDIHSHRKWLFGGRETFDEIKPDISGLGAAFLLFNSSIPSIQLAGNKHISFGLQKAFVLPWGFTGNYPDQISTLSWNKVFSAMRTILLSGLSVHGSFSW
ncbi:MAG: hypothetical protein LBC80_01345 [Treponema sp.]|nr:hypothetical protein [Treponema sp.]